MRTFFEQVFGNENIKAHIGRAISEGTLPHALMLIGPVGSGKLMLAKEIAAALNCNNAKSMSHALPCGTCNNCRRIRGEQFLDVHIFRKKEDKASVGINEIREFLADVTMSGSESDFRVYIFNDSDIMTHQAQNSLLKVLEEPPAGVYIILLCESTDSMLTTIKSRTQAYSMSRFDEAALDEFLMRTSEDAKLLKRIDAAGYSAVLSEADGSIGQALSMMNKAAIDRAASSAAFTKKIICSFAHSTMYTQLKEAMASLPKKKQELMYELERVLDGINELISFNFDRSKKRRLFKSEDEAAAQLRQIGIKKLIEIYDLLTDTLDSLNKNANISLLITRITANLCRK